MLPHSANGKGSKNGVTTVSTVALGRGHCIGKEVMDDSAQDHCKALLATGSISVVQQREREREREREGDREGGSEIAPGADTNSLHVGGLCIASQILITAIIWILLCQK